MFRRFARVVLWVSLVAAASAPSLSPAHGALASQAQASPGPAAAPDAPQAPANHHVLLLDGFVNSFTAASPLVYWYTQAVTCQPTPDATRILRIREAGLSEMRYLFNHVPLGGEPCPHRIYSNLAVDSQHVYWVNRSGLVRLPVLANPTDAPETLLPDLAAQGTELVMMGDYLVGISGPSIWYMQKSNPLYTFEIGYLGSDTGGMLKTDGTYAYFIQQPGGHLRRFDLAGDFFNITAGVSDYTPSGLATICVFSQCTQYNYVYYVINTSPLSIKTYDNIHNTYDTTYTANLPTGIAARIYGLTAGKRVLATSGPEIFFWEKRWTPCGCLETDSTDHLNRLYSGVLYSRPSKTTWFAQQTQAGGEFLFWKDIIAKNDGNWGSVFRLAQTTPTTPVVNLRVWGWEVNQSVQDKKQQMFLIRNKRTFLRLFVSADGGSTVNGVTARVSAYWGGQYQGAVAPVTPLIAVGPAQNKQLFNNQFVFDLPVDWLNHADLTLVPELNPGAFPQEPTYDDNRFADPPGPFTIRDNPTARFSLVAVAYNWNGATSTSADQDAIVSWLYRAYPIGLAPGQEMPTRFTYTNNTNLGSRIQNFNNEPACQSLNQTANGGGDDRNLCASFYLHSQLEMFRRTNALPTDAYIYASAVGLARGSASPTGPVANGPDLVTGGTDFALAGYYAGHEIGHLLGRAHPTEMSDDPATSAVTEGCGHSRSDPNFPYTFGWIGNLSNDNYGIDSRMNVPGGALRVMGYSNVRDVMTYCGTPDQWVSDYTYRGMYNWLNENPGPGRPPQARLPESLPRPGSAAAVQVDGWLNLGGNIAAGGSSGMFNLVLRAGGMTLTPVQTPGPYTIRLLDGSGVTLADYPFTPIPSTDSPGWLTFFETVPFAVGTRTIQVLRSGAQVVMSKPVSPNPPGISNVDSRPSANTAAAQVTLNWTAADPDGDPLTFTVLFSQDRQTFEPVAAEVSGRSLVIDTGSLPGGMGFFRLIASDGVNTAYVDSSPLQIENKPPVVHILAPSQNQHTQYSAPLNFSGYADDPQDGSLTGAMLTWSTQYGSFASGPNAVATNMPTGWVTVTLTAQNSLGLSGSDAVRIFVGDDLADPPAILSVVPSAINYQAENGSSASLQANVLITNGGGGGSLGWSADLHGTPWLSASSLSGTTPYTLTLAANPTGLEAGSNFSALLTIRVTGGQTIDIPVNLQTGAGQSWTPPVDPPPTGTGQTIYLPVVKR